MSVLLALVILLFLILYVSFGYKEGYYSDTNTSAAAASMKTIADSLTTLDSTLTTLLNQDLTVDAQSKMTPLLNPSDDKLYSSGIVQQSHRLSDLLSDYQDDIIQLKHSLDTIKDIPVSLKEGSLPLSVAIATLKKNATNLMNELNTIPDS